MKNMSCPHEGHGQGGGVMNLQEAIAHAMRSGKQDKRKFTEMLKELIDTIKKDNPKDRLGRMCSLRRMIYAIQKSLQGWAQWYIAVDPLGEMTDEEWKEVYETFKKATLAILELDLKITDRAEKETEKKIKEQTKKKGKKTPKKDTHYVA